MNLTFDIIRDYDTFLGVRDQWNSLTDASPSAHAFFRHEWFECWLKHLSPVSNMAFFVARNGPDLVAAAPMQHVSTTLKHLPVRQMVFAGSSITPRSGLLLRPEVDTDSFCRYLFQKSGGHLVLASQMAEESDSTAALLGFLDRERGGRYLIEPNRRSPYLLTEGTFDDYWSSLSKSITGDVRRAENKLRKLGELEIRSLPDAAALEAALPDLAEASSRSWKAEVQRDLGSLPQVVDFLKQFGRLGETPRLWEVWEMRLDGRVIAFQVYLRYGRMVSEIRHDFDVEFSSFSPGKVLQMAVIRDLYGREGVWEYDMGGNAYGYKLRWTKLIRAHIDLWAAGPGLYGRALMFGKRRILPLLTGRQEPAGPDAPDRGD